jgi:ubiquinone/menaquinone biosynthesis C-methylase UbiE
LSAEIRRLLRDNGPQWTALFCVNRAVRAIERATDLRLMRLEEMRALSGINTVARNRDLWNGYDWTASGENWTPSAEWKQALVDQVMLAYLPADADVLEIGPGAGRWTEILQPRARQLTLVDISTRCLELCQARFAAAQNIRYVLSAGAALPGVPDAGIDFIWSFDVFVHISPVDTEAYLKEFRRVLRPGGRAVIHHPKRGRVEGGYRSSMTAELFTALLKQHGLQFVRQFDSWGPAGEFDVRLHGDAITVFGR